MGSEQISQNPRLEVILVPEVDNKNIKRRRESMSGRGEREVLGRQNAIGSGVVRLKGTITSSLLGMAQPSHRYFQHFK